MEAKRSQRPATVSWAVVTELGLECTSSWLLGPLWRNTLQMTVLPHPHLSLFPKVLLPGLAIRAQRMARGKTAHFGRQ